MHNTKVASRGKCRRLFYSKVPGDANPTNPDLLLVMGVASGGGGLMELSGDDLIIATFNEHHAPTRIGCVEEFFNPVPAAKPIWMDRRRVDACKAAVDNHRAAKQTELDYIEWAGVALFGSELTLPNLHKALRFAGFDPELEVADPGKFAALKGAYARLAELRAECEKCCDALLDERDLAITFETVEQRQARELR